MKELSFEIRDALDNGSFTQYKKWKLESMNTPEEDM